MVKGLEVASDKTSLGQKFLLHFLKSQYCKKSAELGHHLEFYMFTNEGIFTSEDTYFTQA